MPKDTTVITEMYSGTCCTVRILFQLFYRREISRWSSLIVLVMTKYNFKGLKINGTMNKKVMGQKNFS
jgi:hypothetical protein